MTLLFYAMKTLHNLYECVCVFQKYQDLKLADHIKLSFACPDRLSNITWIDHEEASGSGKRFRSDDVVDSRGSPNIRTVRVGDYRFFWCNLVLNLLYRFVLEREKLID